jgi:hypothetical protein
MAARQGGSSGRPAGAGPRRAPPRMRPRTVGRADVIANSSNASNGR